MKTQFVLMFLLFLLNHKVTYALTWSPQASTENDVYLQGFTLESSKVTKIFACYLKCEDNTLCTSINMNLTDKTCELKYSTKTRHPEKIVQRQNMIYLEIRDAHGSTSRNPIQSCKWLKNLDSHAKSGVYWMKFNDPSSTPFQVFCEMTIDGGGWTLVYSYTFTRYNDFNSKQNAVTPIPNWPVDRCTGTWVPESTTTPLSESYYSAMGFALWKKIGKEFLLKSNITNWVACVEGTGSLVNWVEGSVTCRIVKAITSTCTTVTPVIFKSTVCGPVLYSTSYHYIFLEGRRDTCWPAHDPCGTSSAANHLTNLPSPAGSLFVR